MQDSLNRKIDYIRVSLTDRCNLRCVYCMPEAGVQWIPHKAILTYEELLRLCRIFSDLGIRKVKLTGGEPLLRKGVTDLIRRMREIPGIESVTLTTNGVLLEEMAADLVAAGIDAVTVSLDTLDREQYIAITRRDELPRVLRGIDRMAEYPACTLKINAVSLADTEDQYAALARFAQDRPIHVRFIEMMPIGLGSGYRYHTEEEVRAILEKAYGTMTPYTGSALGNGPCHYFTLPGFRGRIGFISAMSHSFCDTCNRVRLTSGGFLKTCLQYETGVDLRALIASGADDEKIRDAVRLAIYNKPKSHQFTEKSDPSDGDRHTMSQIGG